MPRRILGPTGGQGLAAVPGDDEVNAFPITIGGQSVQISLLWQARLSACGLNSIFIATANDIPAMKLAAASSQSSSMARLTANQRIPFILQTH